ncbi:MAG: hypothetical protein LBU15_04205 [Rickettsiales bacterium]|jgi:hypothetical protein|nr:hypothetical protein [Rickettsiales bacterium]
MSEPPGGNENFLLNRFSNQTIFSTRDGELKKTKEVSDEDIRLLREAGLLGDVKTLGKDFDLNSSYFSSDFVKEMIENVREEYSDVAAELPISFVDNSSPFFEIPMEHRAGLNVIYGDAHTVLTVAKPIATNETEIYVLDALDSSPKWLIEQGALKAAGKFVIKYPITDVGEDAREKIRGVIEERKKLRKSYIEKGMDEELFRLANEPLGYNKDKLMIQMDYTHCISYAIHFAEKIYKAVREEKARSNCTALESFNKVMEKFEILQDKDVGSRYETHNAFRMPYFLTKHSGSEDALGTIAAATAKRGKVDEAAVIEKSKGKLKLYKDKRQEKYKEQTENLRGELVSTKLELEKTERAFTEGNVTEVGGEDREMLEQRVKELDKKSKEIDGKIKVIETRMREIYSPAANWRNKDIKNVADGIRRRGGTLGGFVTRPEVATGLGPETSEKEKKVVAEKSPVQQPLPSSSSLPLGVFKNMVKTSTDIISGPPSAANVSNLPSPPPKTESPALK